MPTLETYLPEAKEIAVENLEEELTPLAPEERIERTVELFAGSVIVATSCGPTAPVLLDKVRIVAPELPVINVRTHHETLETTQIVTWFERESNLNFHIFDATPTPIPPASSSLTDFQEEVKVKPFQKALNTFQPAAYLSGAMRWQSPQREALPFVEKRGAVLAIRPIVDVDFDEAQALLDETNLRYPKHYFDPTKGPDQKLECRLNTTDFTLTEREGR